jgi:hypothetical protein
MKVSNFFRHIKDKINIVEADNLAAFIENVIKKTKK